MGMTRKGFLGAAAGGLVVLLVQGCGGGDDDDGRAASSADMQCGSSGAEISGNHGHALVVAVADLDSTTDKTYSIVGTASHDHAVTLTAAQLQSLKQGRSVKVTSAVTFSHSHELTISCA